LSRYAGHWLNIPVKITVQPLRATPITGVSRAVSKPSSRANLDVDEWQPISARLLARRIMRSAMDGDTLLGLSGWALYVGIALLPFFQEDLAVIAAATASIMGAAPVPFLFVAILVGLSASDVWKYWLGFFAREQNWARRLAQKNRISMAGDLLQNELAKTLYMARFIPGTRVPAYMACGFFRVPYAKFCALVVVTALTYITIMFILFHAVGALAGEWAKYGLPGMAVLMIGGYGFVRWLRRTQISCLF
jgi:membrane protein DedA with SNARE-associated domain